MSYKCDFCLNEIEGGVDVICNATIQCDEELFEYKLNCCHQCYKDKSMMIREDEIKEG